MVPLPIICLRSRPPFHLQTPPPSGFLSQNRLWINTAQATRSGYGVGHVRQKSTILHKCIDPGFMEPGGVDSGISFWTGEFLSCALGPSGTGLGNMQARLIFSQPSKYCPPCFSTGNPVMSWEQSIPGNSVLGEERKEEHSCSMLFFCLSIGKARIIGALGIRSLSI